MRRQETLLPHPKSCNVCNSETLVLTTVDKVSNRACEGWPWIWYCSKCKASVSCHPNTYNPMGLLASADIRKSRSIAHYYFDKIWKQGHMSRREAYTWLASKLKIVLEKCHISHLDEWQLEKTIDVSKKFLNPDNIVKFNRDKKRNVRLAKQRTREQALIKRRREGN